MDFPNIRHLQAVVETARLRRVALAADMVHLSQPAVTHAIAKIEKNLGAKLFDRRPDGMFCTRAGQLFRRRAERMIDLLQEGAAEAARRAGRDEKFAGEGAARKDFHGALTPVHLRTLLAMATAGNYSQAARALGVSQPSVHRAAKDLQRLAGIRFFESNRRGVALTLPGELLARQARLAAAELQQAVYEIAEAQGREATRITVGAMPLARTAILPQAIDDVIGASPGAPQIRTVEGPYPDLLRALRFGEIDFMIGAMRQPSPADDVEQEPLFDDPLSVVVSKTHPLVGRSSVSLDDTLQYPWIAPPLATPAGSYLSETLKIPSLPGTPVKIVSSSLVMVRGLMMRGDYITIMSRRQIALEEESGVLTTLPIPLENNERSIGLTFRKGWHPTPAQGRLITRLREIGATLSEEPLSKI
ncbi:LysR family transcriptional regulator [Oceanicola sp. 502str15]|uniref:LysR family transcriptional regulator n=1 Tax=Oceanicola sp. 502str15 TaxID=2696061 RepID=UPI002094D623|nr:LysR family transcriptional regulator [Oceanicola sp. 502str15]MCO6382918.1 LysR family transcriptional regulator [Oceanicola sp. 502str15]